MTVGTPMRTAQHVHMHVRIVRGRSRPPRARLCGIGDKRVGTRAPWTECAAP